MGTDVFEVLLCESLVVRNLCYLSNLWFEPQTPIHFPIPFPLPRASFGPMSSRNGILLLSGGSKLAIARIAKTAAARRGAQLVVSDRHPDIPSRFAADSFALLPHHQAPDWADQLLRLCRERGIGLILPTRHCELLALAELKAELAAQGAVASISSPQAVRACIHKLDTFAFLRKIEVPTPETALKEQIARSPLAGRFPLFAKPEAGAASLDARLVEGESDLATVPDDWVLQERALGQEYTVNLYLNRQGKALCAIPHQRIAVESGEVTQARTQRLQPLIEQCRKIAESLPGAVGILNIQAFHHADSGTLKIIEINPRLGGGYPLCDAAKGHYIEWLCQEYLDGSEPQPFDRWTENLLMLRYRDAIFQL